MSSLTTEMIKLTNKAHMCRVALGVSLGRLEYPGYNNILCSQNKRSGRCVLGGVNNHIKALKLKLPGDQRELLTEGP